MRRVTISTLSVALCAAVPVTVWLPIHLFAQPRPVTEEDIDRYFDHKLTAFRRVISEPRCEMVAEGEVVAVEPSPYFEGPTFGNAIGRWHVGRRVLLKVAVSYKAPLPTLIEFWTHGGRLPLENYDQTSPWPLGCGSSIDIPPLKPGDHIIVSLRSSRDGLDEDQLWTWGGESGLVRTDLQCSAFKTDQLSMLWDEETLKYYHDAKVIFLEEVHALLGHWQTWVPK